MVEATIPGSLSAWCFAWKDGAWSDSPTYESRRYCNQPLQRSAAAGTISGVVTVLDGPHEVSLVATRLAAVHVGGHADHQSSRLNLRLNQRLSQPLERPTRKATSVNTAFLAFPSTR